MNLLPFPHFSIASIQLPSFWIVAGFCHKNRVTSHRSIAFCSVFNLGSYWTCNTWKNRHTKNQAIFSSIYPRQRKVWENKFFGPHHFHQLCLVLHKVVLPFFFKQWEFCYVLYYYSKSKYITNVLGCLFFTSFCKYVKWGSEEKWVFLIISQGIAREFWFVHWVWTLLVLCSSK